MDPFLARRLLMVAIALILGLLVWLLFIKDDDSDSDSDSTASSEAEPATKTVEVLPAAELPSAAAAAGFPVYWVGPAPDTEYEVTVISDGRTYVRYLPKGSEKGVDARFLTVGSYARTDAVKAVQTEGAKPGARTFDVDGGGVAFAQESLPTSVYVAYPGVDVQFEVFDPAPGKAERHVTQGKLAPVG